MSSTYTVTILYYCSNINCKFYGFLTLEPGLCRCCSLGKMRTRV